MAFSNSPLVVYTSISPNRNNGRYDNSNRANPVPITKITKITIHHMAGVCSLENFNNIVSKPSRQMSSNYAIGNDGRIGLFCEEKDRSWCSSSEWNDNRAITIEVSNSAYGDASGWPISDAAYKSLINLCVDICKRNGISKLEFTGDKNGSLTYHYFYTQTCCPGPWIKAHTQEICDKVNTALGVNNSTSLGLYTISLKTGDPIYDKPNGTKTGEISASTKYTITEESSVNGYKYGKLKSGAGWVIVEKPAVASTGIKAGDTVSIKQGATYYNGQTIPAFVMNDKWIVSSVNGDRAVLGQNVSKTQNITSPINTKYLTVVSVSASGSVSVSYTKQINGSTPLYATPGGAVTGTVGTTGVYTITYESTVNGVKYGKLKSGIGWVNLNQTSSVSTSTTSTEIKKGDTVKVLDPVIYGSTKKFYNISSTYKVLEISGNRVVISADGRNVTAAIDKKYLQKV